MCVLYLLQFSLLYSLSVCVFQTIQISTQQLAGSGHYVPKPTLIRHAPHKQCRTSHPFYSQHQMRPDFSKSKTYLFSVLFSEFCARTHTRTHARTHAHKWLVVFKVRED